MANYVSWTVSEFKVSVPQTDKNGNVVLDKDKNAVMVEQTITSDELKAKLKAYALTLGVVLGSKGNGNIIKTLCLKYKVATETADKKPITIHKLAGKLLVNAVGLKLTPDEIKQVQDFISNA